MHSCTHPFITVTCENCGEVEVPLHFCRPTNDEMDKGEMYGYNECECKNNGNLQHSVDSETPYKLEYLCNNEKVVIDLVGFKVDFGECDLCDYHGSINIDLICKLCGDAFPNLEIASV